LYLVTYTNISKSGQLHPSSVPALVQKLAMIAGRYTPLTAQLEGGKQALVNPSKDGFY
jgi:hypothetical protein